jgi:hypothetical protein
MLFWVVFIIITIFVIWYNIVEYNDFFDYVLGIVASFAIWGITFFLIWLGVEMGIDPKQKVINTEIVELSAVVDNVENTSYLSGNIFVIQAYSEEELKYYYMYKDSEKGLAYGEANAKNCYINHTDEQPYLKILSYDYSNWFMKWAFPTPGNTEYIFYLPEDAKVIEDFEIDFK